MSKFRVRSGDLNVVVERPWAYLEDWTQEMMIGIVKEALEKCKKDYLEFGELLCICECPLTSKDNCYWISTKAAIEKAGFKITKEKKP